MFASSFYSDSHAAISLTQKLAPDTKTGTSQTRSWKNRSRISSRHWASILIPSDLPPKLVQAQSLQSCSEGDQKTDLD